MTDDEIQETERLREENRRLRAERLEDEYRADEMRWRGSIAPE